MDMERLRVVYACLVFILSSAPLQNAQSICNAGEAPGHHINITVNCHSLSLSPQVTYGILDPDVSDYSVVMNIFYTCNVTRNETTTIVEEFLFNGVPDSTKTKTGKYSLTPGTECTIYGCYHWAPDAHSMGTFLIPPISCTIDVDECDPKVATNDCDPNAVCNNTIGSFDCLCNPGFEGNGSHCTDINECDPEIATNDCDPNAVCNNTIGSFDCLCNPGFEGNGPHCTDINECDPEIAANDCDPNAVCNNTIGSFDCLCNPGFEGNGSHCTGIHEDCENCTVDINCTTEGGISTCNVPCKTGSNCTGSITDVDGCTKHNCHENAVCTDTELGYNCTCLDGYKGNGFVCTAIIVIAIDERTPARKSPWIAVYIVVAVLAAVGAVFSITVGVICRARRKRLNMHEAKKPYLQLLKNTRWNEVDHDYNPVSIETFQWYPSLLSILEQLNTQSRSNSMEPLDKKLEECSDRSSCSVNTRNNSPIAIQREPVEKVCKDCEDDIVLQDGCDIPSLVFSMGKESCQDIQQDCSSINISSDRHLSDEDEFDKTDACERVPCCDYVGTENGRDVTLNTLPQHVRTPLCNSTGSSGYGGDYFTIAEIYNGSNLSVRSNNGKLCRIRMCPTPNLDSACNPTPPITHDTTGSSGYGSDYTTAMELFSHESCRSGDLPSMCPTPNLDSACAPITHDTTGSSGYGSDYTTAMELFSRELCRSGDLPSMCPTPNLDSACAPITHDTTGSSGYGSDYTTAMELFSHESCRSGDLPSMCPTPNLDSACDPTPPITHDTTGSSGYGSDYTTAMELIKNGNMLYNGCYNQLHSKTNHIPNDHTVLCAHNEMGSSSNYITEEQLHERNTTCEITMDTNYQYSKAEPCQGTTGLSDYVATEELSAVNRQPELTTLQQHMTTGRGGQDYTTEIVLFQNC